MHVRLTLRGRALCKVLGKAGAWVAGFLLVIKTLALIFHGIGSAFSSSPHAQVQSTPPHYTPLQNWARTYPPPTPAQQQTASNLMPTQPTEPPRITYRPNPITMPQLTYAPNPIVMPQLTTTQSQPQRQDNPPLTSAPYQPPDSSVIFIGNIAYSPLSAPDVALAPDAVPLKTGQPAMTQTSRQQSFSSPPLRSDATVNRSLAAIYREFLQQREATRLAIERERQVQAERVAAERREQNVRGRQSPQDAERRRDGGTVRTESVEQRDREAREREEEQRREAEARQQAASRNQTHGSHSDRDGSQNSGR
jgi:hypothetical protein